MIGRIRTIIDYSRLSTSAFADTIGISRSGLTHLLTGRNQPSLDVARKILAKYPEISTEWLIMGMGEMMRSDEKQSSEPTITPTNVTSEQYPDENLKIGAQTELFGEFEPADDSDEIVSSDIVESSDQGDENPQETAAAVTTLKTPTASPAPAQMEASSRRHMEPKHNVTPVVKRERRTSNAIQERKLEKIIFFYNDHSFEIYNNG